MDSNLKKAFESADYASVMASQKRIILEEFSQSMIFYHNGGTFKITRELISFIKCLIDLNQNDAVVIDDNSLPIDVMDLRGFLENLLDRYSSSLNEYHSKYQKIKNKRTLESLLEL